MRETLCVQRAMLGGWRRLWRLFLLIIVLSLHETGTARASDPLSYPIPWEPDRIPLQEFDLPDLQTLPPFDLQLVVDPDSKKRILRFSNSVWNSGPGAMELHGSYTDRPRVAVVTQVIYGPGGAVKSHPAGKMEYHAIHGHWHWDHFSRYEIWSVRADGSFREKVASSGKVGYCMLDTSKIDKKWIRKSALVNWLFAERPQYRKCDWKLQGISSGWVDTYDLDTPGQDFDVSRLSDGFYALRSTVDPEGILVEANTGNNTSVTYFTLRGNRLRIIGESIPKPQPSISME